MFSFFPVVTEIASDAASLNLPNILPDEVMDVAEGGSLSPSIEGFENFSPTMFYVGPKSIFLRVVD
jgi:hypothetical protein